jgi:hypothetical protein
LIHDLRTAFGKPELHFVIASTGMAARGGVEQPPYSGYSDVERAQLWAAGIPHPDKVSSFDTRPFWRDPAQAVSTIGHHWNHSGESYFLVGKALGDDMVNLLTP